jgi:hypothetical protein
MVLVSLEGVFCVRRLQKRCFLCVDCNMGQNVDRTIGHDVIRRGAVLVNWCCMRKCSDTIVDNFLIHCEVG